MSNWHVFELYLNDQLKSSDVKGEVDGSRKCATSLQFFHMDCRCKLSGKASILQKIEIVSGDAMQ